MSKATESMFDGKDVLIPLAEVSYILKFPSCIEVHFKGSAESVTLVQPDQNALISAWCRYRSEVEADTLMDLDGAQSAPSILEGWVNELLTIEHAMAMNNWNWNSDASDDLKLEAYTAVTRLLAAAPEAKP